MRKIVAIILGLLIAVVAVNAQTVGGNSSSKYTNTSKSGSQGDYGNTQDFVARLDVALGYMGLKYGKDIHNTYGLEVGYRYRRHEFGLALDCMPLYGNFNTISSTVDGIYVNRFKDNGFSMPLFAYYRFYFLKKKISPFVTAGLGGCIAIEKINLSGNWSGQSSYMYDIYREGSENYEERVMGLYYTLGIGCSFMNIFNVELQNIFSFDYWSWSNRSSYFSTDGWGSSGSDYNSNSGDNLCYAFSVKLSVNFVELGRTLSSKNKR